jgi:membrane protein required for colicin V production
MNVFDIIIASFLIFGFVRGIMKGLLIEVASLVALIGGVYGAIHFSYMVSDYLNANVAWKKEYVSLMAYALTFIVIVMAIVLLGKMLTKLANFAALGILNKILGGIFGFLKIGLILSIIFLLFNKMNSAIPFIKKETLDTSILYIPVKKIGLTLFPTIIKENDKVDTELQNLGI